MKYLEAQRLGKKRATDDGENKMLTGSRAVPENKSRTALRGPRPSPDAAKTAMEDGSSEKTEPTTKTETGANATIGARELAASLGVDLAVIKGTGNEGKITTADVRDAHAKTQKASDTNPE